MGYLRPRRSLSSVEVGTIDLVFILMGAGLAFALLVPLVLRQHRAGNLVWLGAAAAGALVVGATVQGFGQQPAPCDEVTATWLHHESSGAQESFRIETGEGTIAAVDAGAPPTDAALRCSDADADAAGE